MVQTLFNLLPDTKNNAYNLPVHFLCH